MGGRAIPALLVAAGLPAMAANIGGDIPFGHFTDKDRAIFRETLEGALEKGADGAAIAWSNPDTKARGEITPQKSFERDGKPCRSLIVENHAKGRSAKGPFTLCKADGKWAIVKASAGK